MFHPHSRVQLIRAELQPSEGVALPDTALTSFELRLTSEATLKLCQCETLGVDRAGGFVKVFVEDSR